MAAAEECARETSASESVDFSIADKLRALSDKQLHNLITDVIIKAPDSHRVMLEWFKKNKTAHKETAEKDETALNDGLLMDYWGNAQPIISKFSEYGGGDDDEEEEAGEWLSKISELVKNGKVSTDAKFAFLDEAFEEYDAGNSGFDDALMDTFYDICRTKEEWEYLVKKLAAYPTDWRRKKIMEILRKHICDDKRYLEMRLQTLDCGRDYWDLVEFYVERGDSEKAIETAETGILKADGCLTEMLNFLWNHFAGKKDTLNLERIVNTALNRETDEKEMLERLLEYYKEQGDYENTKTILLKSFEFCRNGEEYVSTSVYRGHYFEYKRMKALLNDSDWREIEPKIFNEIKEKNIKDYLRICLDKGMKKVVLDIVLKHREIRTGFFEPLTLDEFADKIKEEFPQKIIEYYWKKAYPNIQSKSRLSYHAAAIYLEKVKYIYVKILKDEQTWKNRFLPLKDEFKKRPAFIDEVRDL